MKFFGIALFSLLLFGCSNVFQKDAEPVVVGDWLELPMQEGTFSELSRFHVETYEVVIPANDWIETKVEMDIGEFIVYRWELIEDETTTDATRDLINTEFHGHAPKVEGELAELMFYRKATGGSGQGTLTAPFSGIHGWFIDNTNNHDISVLVSVAGEFSRYN